MSSKGKRAPPPPPPVCSAVDMALKRVLGIHTRSLHGLSVVRAGAIYFLTVRRFADNIFFVFHTLLEKRRTNALKPRLVDVLGRFSLGWF